MRSTSSTLPRSWPDAGSVPAVVPAVPLSVSPPSDVPASADPVQLQPDLEQAPTPQVDGARQTHVATVEPERREQRLGRDLHLEAPHLPHVRHAADDHLVEQAVEVGTGAGGSPSAASPPSTSVAASSS